MSSSGKHALVVGSTGIVGRSLAAMLAREGWTTFGLSRSGSVELPGVTPLRADLLDPAALTAAMAGVRPSLVAIAAVSSRLASSTRMRSSTISGSSATVAASVRAAL